MMGRFSSNRLLSAAIFVTAFLAARAALGVTVSQLIEGAKKEGILRAQWGQGSFGGSAGFAELLAGMNKKYGLNLKGQYTPGPDMQRMMLRIAQEVAAGQPGSTDVYLGNSQAMLDAIKTNTLKPADWKSFLPRPLLSEAGYDPVAPGGIGVAFASTLIGILYNSDLVKGADIPRSMEDVLKPKWKGKIASTPYAAGLREFAMPDMLGRERILDFAKKLSKQIGGLMRCGEPERIISGEFLMLVFTCGGNDANVHKAKGAPIDHVLVKEATAVHMRYAGIPKNSRSPNAAALFIAYLHTPEAQALLWRHDGLDMHLYPESKQRKEIEGVKAAGGKFSIISPQWLGSVKGYAETQEQIQKILREGGK